jgi:hypothetical protein
MEAAWEDRREALRGRRRLGRCVHPVSKGGCLEDDWGWGCGVMSEKDGRRKGKEGKEQGKMDGKEQGKREGTGEG